MLSLLHPDRRQLLGQLARFAMSGAAATALGVGVYAMVALVLRWHPQLGNFLAYAIAVVAGYFMHSTWSFKDHGTERTHATKFRFVVVSIISYALNSFWVWLLFSHLQLGPEAPIAPMLFITPLVTFALNRQWVFR
ncbi:MAG TPA: GtrA family protein [Sphingomicrobium sp.]|nr:GtrA family protein [Sphingomicrobium sp.]